MQGRDVICSEEILPKESVHRVEEKKNRSQSEKMITFNITALFLKYLPVLLPCRIRAEVLITITNTYWYSYFYFMKYSLKYE